jgi:hypothetical protein
MDGKIEPCSFRIAGYDSLRVIRFGRFILIIFIEFSEIH